MKMRDIFTGLAVALVVWGAGSGVPPAAAQTPELRSLTDQVERLRKDIRDLQRYVYRGNVPPAGGQVAPAEGADSAARAARIDVRLGQLEEEMRGLTGTIERVAHDIDRLATRIDKLVGDVDVRLTAIERVQAEQARLAAAPAPEAPAPQAPPSSEPGTLGTLTVGAAPAQPATSPPAEPAPATAALAPALPPGTPKQQYDYAFSLLRQAEYAEAERALRAFIEVHPDDKLTGNAYYWLAETYYVRSDYARAAEYFARGYKNFPDSIKAPDNLLKLGMSLANLDRKDEACLTFGELGERFPNASPSIKQRVATESRRTGCS